MGGRGRVGRARERRGEGARRGDVRSEREARRGRVAVERTWRACRCAFDPDESVKGASPRLPRIFFATSTQCGKSTNPLIFPRRDWPRASRGLPLRLSSIGTLQLSLASERHAHPLRSPRHSHRSRPRPWRLRCGSSLLGPAARYRRRGFDRDRTRRVSRPRRAARERRAAPRRVDKPARPERRRAGFDDA